jgi:hypothetical protein
MSWTSSAEIFKQLERRWKSGDLIRALLHGGDGFPMRLRLSVPTPRDMAAEFARTQEWVAMLRSLPGIRLECRSIRSQMLGHQELPSALWVDTPEDAIAHLQAQAEVERILALHASTMDSLPEIIPWLEASPLRALALETSWERILRVVAWRKSRPALPQVYVRQIDLPGVDSKFIESNTAVLSELFDLVSQSKGADRAVADFRARHGFLREPNRIRFRILDPGLHFAALPGCPDVELDENSFAALRLPVRRVFVTENKTNFLTFPLVHRSIVVFGAGYGMRALGHAQWIHELPLYYWGDIDTHGFAILSQLREFFPHAVSFLMDEETLTRHKESWTAELAPTRHPITLLSATETALFQKLQTGVEWKGVRLEQEKVLPSFVDTALDQILSIEKTPPSD